MIKAIETVYDNHRFRSRLEARWATFFNAAGIPYEYEPEGYDLGKVKYLPDFYLPEQKCFVEVKGQKPIEEEIEKAELLAEQSHTDVHIFYGEIEIPGPVFSATKTVSQIITRIDDKDEVSYLEGEMGWAQCPWCLALDITQWNGFHGVYCGCSRQVWKSIHLKPLENLVKQFPSIAEKEPKDNIPRMKLYYRLKIGDWWHKKLNSLIYTGDSPRLVAAFTAARQARFEHGEKP
jgi:hypothetical protein